MSYFKLIIAMDKECHTSFNYPKRKLIIHWERLGKSFIKYIDMTNIENRSELEYWNIEIQT